MEDVETSFQPKRREAAVAVVLRPYLDTAGQADAQILFVRRASYPGDPWSGHIALPGGRRESRDVTLEDTARRETYEETGLDLTGAPCVATLGAVAPRTIIRPAIVVRPYVFRYEGEPTVTLSDEVVEAFWLSISQLHHPDAWRDTPLEINGEIRIVRGFPYGEHLIWGLTERTIAQLLERADLDALIK